MLAKNRDCTYDAPIEIIHEIVNGIEVVYLYDSHNGWIEGMNEHRIGIVNSTVKDVDVPTLHQGLAHHHKGIYHLLTKPHPRIQDIHCTINDATKNKNLEGHSILFHHDKFIHIVKTDGPCVSSPITPPQVYTNNVEEKPCSISIFLRRQIIKKELTRRIRTVKQLASVMNQTYSNIHPQHHPYRDTNYTVNSHITPNTTFAHTTGQLLLNMTDLTFTYFADVHHTKYVTYTNKLPKGYLPKIKVVIQPTQKNIKKPKKIFTKKYLSKVVDKYYCKKGTVW